MQLSFLLMSTWLVVDLELICTFVNSDVIFHHNWQSNRPVIFHSQPPINHRGHQCENPRVLAKESQILVRPLRSTAPPWRHCQPDDPLLSHRFVFDVIDVRPPDAPYDILKNRLIEVFTPTSYRQVEGICNMPSLGDWRPSELMNGMLAIEWSLQLIA